VSGRFGSPTTRSGSLYRREGSYEPGPLRSESQVHNTGEQVGLYVLLIPAALTGAYEQHVILAGKGPRRADTSTSTGSTPAKPLQTALSVRMGS
jgi:hypothetical protein